MFHYYYSLLSYEYCIPGKSEMEQNFPVPPEVLFFFSSVTGNNQTFKRKYLIGKKRHSPVVSLSQSWSLRLSLAVYSSQAENLI